MNKQEIDFLERVFTADIEERLYQTKSKLAKKMEEDGFIIEILRHMGNDRFGEIVVKGYSLTLKGNFAYCTSKRCANVAGI